MEITSEQKNIGSSPRKMRLVADMVRKMKPEQALQTLRFTNKSAALPLAKVIKTALANVKAQGKDAQEFVFKSLEVNEGIKMKRFAAGSKGRARPYTRRFSHVKIVLSDEKKEESRSVRP